MRRMVRNTPRKRAPWRTRLWLLRHRRHTPFVHIETTPVGRGIRTYVCPSPCGAEYPA